MVRVYSWNGIRITDYLLPEQARELVEKGKAVEVGANSIMLNPHERLPEEWLRAARKRAAKERS